MLSPNFLAAFGGNAELKTTVEKSKNPTYVVIDLMLFLRCEV